LKIIKNTIRFISAIGLSIAIVAPASAQTEAIISAQLAAASKISRQFSNLDSSTIQLASVSATAVDRTTSAPLFEKNADLVMPIASITKLMTAMVVLDAKQPMNERIRFTKQQRQANNNYYTRIRVDSTLPRKDVIRIALMSSENLAASALAHTYPGGIDAFVKAMNRKALQLSMNSSHFVDPTGLSEQNVSTAGDLAKMVSAAATYPEITEFSTTRGFTARFKKPRYRLQYGNTNVLVHRKSWDIDLTKTGYLNEAGRCLVMVTEVEGRDVVMVMLNSYGKRTPVGDAGRIKRWITTGESGKISSTAKHYQRQKLKELMPDQVALK
jgi:D-alanyl-D-alanine endopeptidase (penicillin-binding protein 7)